MMEKSLLLSADEETTTGTVGSRDWYIRSVSAVMATSEEDSVWVEAFWVLSMYVFDWRFWMRTWEIS